MAGAVALCVLGFNQLFGLYTLIKYIKGLFNMDYIIGELYFFITYTDDNLLYPKIYSVVHIGKNLDDEDDEELWYFQDAQIYNEIGAYPDFDKKDSDTGEVDIYSFRELDLEHVKTPKTLYDELEECFSRRNQ